MAIFKDKAIILKIDKKNGKELIYTIFSYEYWKFRANKKFSNKEKSLDLWYIVNLEIQTKEDRNIHKIWNIKIKSEFNQKKSFWELNIFLFILKTIYDEIPDWMANKKVFHIIEKINEKDSNKLKLIFAKLKIDNLLWNLKIENEDKTISKILKFINNSKIEDIFRLKIEKKYEEKLEELI